MSAWDTTLPNLLRRLHELDFDYDEGYDFEPYKEFFSAEENAAWFKAWTGNAEVDGAQFRIFGQDGTGGYAALWLARPTEPLENQPIVFLGSEGEKGVVALTVDEYLWLLASGRGPYEAVAYDGEDGTPNAQFASFARANSKVDELQSSEVLARARSAYPDFTEYIDKFCR